MVVEITGRGWVFPPQIGPHGGIALTGEQDEIEQAIHIILSTAPGERVMRPTFGCRLDSLVFEPNNNQTAARARRYIEQALGMWEPRITVTQVNVYPKKEAQNCLMIEIDFQVKSTHDERSLVYPFYLIPGE